MEDKRKEWSEQFNKNFGVRELLRFSCASGIWMFLGVGISLALAIRGYAAGKYVMLIFLITFFLFPIIVRTWAPAYTIFRKILGNKNIPTEPIPRSIIKSPHQPLPWYGYLPGIWFLLLDLTIIYIIIKNFFPR